LPNWYKSNATIIPPKNNGLVGLLNSGPSSGALKKLAGIGLGGAMSDMGAYNYIAILNSRDLKLQIIQEYDLRDVFEMEDKAWEKVIGKFDEHFGVSVNNDGYISVSYEDKNPLRSTNIANRIVELLNNRSTELSILEASANRDFLQSKVQEVEDSLFKIENKFAELFTEEEFIFIPENFNTISSLSDLFASKKILEIELQLLNNSFNQSSAIIETKRRELAILQTEIDSIPGNLINTLRIYRQYKTNIELLEFLTPALEQAKLELLNNTPVVLTLDQAILPEYKSKPKRSIICILSVTLSLLLTFLVIVITEKIDLETIKRLSTEKSET